MKSVPPARYDSHRSSDEQNSVHRPRINLAMPVIDQEMKDAALASLSEERLVLGESVFRFEEEFARYCGCDYAVSVQSGSAALQLSLVASSLKRNFRCATASASFVSTANCIVHAGGLPTFVDIDAVSNCIDPVQLSRVAGRCSAVIPVHLYGYPADMTRINELAAKENLCVVEDACQAHGASIDGRKVGSWGDFGCFSFYPSKNMTVAGDGGMITTNDNEAAKKLRKLRDCGRKSKYVHDLIGFSFRLNNVNAAIGRIQLRRLDSWNAIRRKLASHYDKRLRNLPGIALPPLGNGSIQPSHHLYVIRTKARNRLKRWLEDSGIECGIHYPLPIHLQPAYRSNPRIRRRSLPNTERLCRTCLSLPMHQSLTSQEVDYITDRVRAFFENGGRFLH
jgi:perosamine synthetase